MKPSNRRKILRVLAVASAASVCATSATADDHASRKPGIRLTADNARLPDTSAGIGSLRRGTDGKIEFADPRMMRDAGPHPCTGEAACSKAEPAAEVVPETNELDGGRWLALPNSHMAPAVYRGPDESRLAGNTGPAAIMSAWRGATFAADSHTLIVWGGGHNDYHGNAVYAFNLRSQAWSMLSQPSSIVGWNGLTPTLPNGTPAVPHTYDALAFVPAMNGMFVAGTAANQVNGNGGPQSWLFDTRTGRWRELALNKLLGGVDTIAAYNPADQNVYVINSAIGLQRYNVADNSWSSIGHRPVSDYHLTGAIDPDGGMLVATGGGFLNVVKLTTGEVTTPGASGDLTVQRGNAPGFAWNAVLRQFVGWNGGSTLYTLDPRTYRWTAHQGAADSLVPPPPASNGTFGRFQYDAADDRFLLVNGIDQDVFVFEPRRTNRPRSPKRRLKAAGRFRTVGPRRRFAPRT